MALFGVGRWGTHLLRNLLAHPQVQLMAVVDPNAANLERVRSLTLPSHTVLAAEAEAVLAREDLDAVVVATPASTHYPLIKTALERGRHVLAEKPLTLDAETSRSLCQLAEKQQRQLVIDHTYLFNPAVQAGQAVVQQETLGRLRYGYAARTHLGPVRWDVDALWDLAIHDIAIFNHWLGMMPVRVQAEGQVWLQAQPQGDLFPQGLSDVVWATLTYPGGLQVKLHFCWCNPDKQRKLCLSGSEGTLIFDEMADPGPLIWQRGTLQSQDKYFIPAEQQTDILPVPMAEPLRAVCDHFVDCVARSQPSPISSGWTGTALVQILQALTQSLNQGGQPQALELEDAVAVGGKDESDGCG
jgi:predicted dehydrogenase